MLKRCVNLFFGVPYFKVLAIFITLFLRAVITRYNAFVMMSVERLRRKIKMRKERIN